MSAFGDMMRVLVDTVDELAKTVKDMQVRLIKLEQILREGDGK